MVRILNAIVGRVHWVHSISEIVFEFVKIQFTETTPKLGKIHDSPVRPGLASSLALDQ